MFHFRQDMSSVQTNNIRPDVTGVTASFKLQTNTDFAKNRKCTVTYGPFSVTFVASRKSASDRLVFIDGKMATRQLMRIRCHL